MAVVLLLVIVALLALKSNENVRALMRDLTGAENKVGFARQFHNDIATRYNTVQQAFSTDLFTAAFGFKNAELSEITNEVDRKASAVDLSRK